MKILYAVRVIVVSFEMVIVLTACLILWHFETQANNIALALNPKEELVKFLIILPLGVFIWIIKESKGLIFSDAQHASQLVNWPDYWKLKMHIYACFGYGILFCVMAAVPWLSKTGITDGKGVVLFMSGVVGIVWVAAGLYFSQIATKEIFTRDTR